MAIFLIYHVIVRFLLYSANCCVVLLYELNCEMYFFSHKMSTFACLFFTVGRFFLNIKEAICDDFRTCIVHIYVSSSDGSGTQNPGFKASWSRYFFIFCHFLGIYDFFPNLLKKFEKSSNMPKIWQKIKETLCLTCFKPNFQLIKGTRSITSI